MSSSSNFLSPLNQSLPSNMMIGEKGKTATTTANNKTLSKRLLYLPLVAYETISVNNNDPTSYLDSRNSLPTSVLEPSLVNFWHQMGVDYHRNIATVHDPKNNGHRPLSASDLDDRIRQRSLTLVRGGINQPTVTTSTGTTSTCKANSSKKRKCNVMKQFITNDSNGTIIINDFLQQLNTLWNHYIFKLLQLMPLSSSVTTSDKEIPTTDYKTCVEDPNFMARITTGLQREKAQLIGAKIRIKDCQHCQQWTGKEGYLVGSTQNTWNVILQGLVSKKRRHKKKRKTTLRDPSQEQAGEEKRDNPSICKRQLGCWKSVVVPKRGSTLSLVIPLLILDKPGINVDGCDRAFSEYPVVVIDIQEDTDSESCTA